MKTAKISAAILLLAFIQTITLSQQIDGWFLAGSKPASYNWGKDTEKYNEQTVYYIKSVDSTIDGFGTVMTYILPDNYIGKRVRLSGYIKNENINSWAGMWMRIDSKEEGKMLGFDNMVNRPIKATSDWTKYEIVLDVPEGSKGIGYGFLLDGTGNAWFSGLIIEPVGKDIPVTNILKEK